MYVVFQETDHRLAVRFPDIYLAMLVIVMLLSEQKVFQTEFLG